MNEILAALRRSKIVPLAASTKIDASSSLT
jgi:hypothetical protein